ncbi:hypothetical protein K501DRAFT_283599 [Backusella circina FSU 941]|nr:hypothetical protein K501DRAFT_283599 [Backusella circina FSU 941]
MSGESKSYRISFHSIDDDELKLLHRDLVTPLPSVRAFEDDNLYRNMVRQRLPLVKPNTRSESVMLFKKINNGDEDVSFDIVNSDFKDFIDTEFMDDVLSHPVSRTTIAENRSRMEELYKGRRLPFYNHDSKPKNNIIRTKPYKQSLVNCSPNQRRDAFDKKESNPLHTRTLSLEKLSISRNQRSEGHHQDAYSVTGDAYSTTSRSRNSVKTDTPHPIRPDRNKFNHTRSVTQPDGSSFHNKKITARNSMASSSVWAPRKSLSQRSTTFEDSIEESSINLRHRHISRAPELLGHTPKSHYSRPIRVSSSSYTQSDDKVTDTSSDDDESDFSGNEKYPYTTTIHRKQSAQELSKTTTMQRSVNDSYFSSPLLHRFSGSNSLNRHEIEYKTVSSPRLKPTTNNNVSVTDSAKQVLAYIRERRKSAMIMESPKQEMETRSLQNTTVPSTDFKTRLNFHRESGNVRRPRNTIKPVIRRFDIQQEEENRLSSRLPQRTIYH